MYLQPAIIEVLPRCTNTGTVLKFFRFERFLNFQGQNQKCCLNYDLRSGEAWNRALVGLAVDKKTGQVCSRVESASHLLPPFFTSLRRNQATKSQKCIFFTRPLAHQLACSISQVRKNPTFSRSKNPHFPVFLKGDRPSELFNRAFIKTLQFCYMYRCWRCAVAPLCGRHGAPFQLSFFAFDPNCRDLFG